MLMESKHRLGYIQKKKEEILSKHHYYLLVIIVRINYSRLYCFMTLE